MNRIAKLSLRRNCLPAVLVAVLVAPALCRAQSQAVTARVEIVRDTSPAKRSRPKRFDSSNVVLWLTPVNTVRVPLPPQRPTPTLMQKNKRFVPHVLVVPSGSVVQFPNEDPFFHNVFSLFEGKRFDLGLYEAGASRNVHFDKPGVCYIFCNIHAEMSAVIVVVDTPYYGISNRAGEIRIAEVPPGQYVAHWWSENASPEQLQTMARRISVGASPLSLGSMRLMEIPALHVAHKNKYGQDYETPAPDSPVYIQP